MSGSEPTRDRATRGINGGRLGTGILTHERNPGASDREGIQGRARGGLENAAATTGQPLGASELGVEAGLEGQIPAAFESAELVICVCQTEESSN